MKIEHLVADIARQPATFEAVVNSANANLRLGSGVAGAIHTAAGPELEEYCQPLAPLALGQAVITPGFKLANRWVIHLRSAHYLLDDAPEAVMAEALRSMLRLAGQHQIKALALPAIGTGVFKFPNDLAADIIVRALRNDAPELAPALERVRICLPSLLLNAAFARALQRQDPNDQRPKTVPDAVQHLVETLPAETRQTLAALREDELIKTHYGLAAYLRNTVLHDNPLLLADTQCRHLDDASHVIVQALWSRLGNRENGTGSN